MDLRMLVVGALLPDLIDTPVGFLFYNSLGSVRLITHSLLVATVVMVGVVLSTRRGRPRKAWMPLAIGLLLHLVLDAVWLDPETLWWPLFGLDFAPTGAETLGSYVGEIITDWRVWLGELAGLVYLAYLARAARLNQSAVRRAFFKDGRVDVPIDGEVSC